MVAVTVAMIGWGTKVSLDAKFYYSRAEARAFLLGLSDEQMRDYFRNEWMDLLFMTFYTGLLYAWASRASTSRVLRRAALVPGFFDAIETLTLLAVMKGRDAPAWLGAVTCIKWSAAGAVLIALIVAALRKKSRTIA